MKKLILLIILFKIIKIDKKINNSIKSIIEKLKTKYHTYININRLSIPIISRINSGKSTFYNFFRFNV